MNYGIFWDLVLIVSHSVLTSFCYPIASHGSARIFYKLSSSFQPSTLSLWPSCTARLSTSFVPTSREVNKTFPWHSLRIWLKIIDCPPMHDWTLIWYHIPKMSQICGLFGTLIWVAEMNANPKGYTHAVLLGWFALGFVLINPNCVNPKSRKAPAVALCVDQTPFARNRASSVPPWILHRS